MEAGAAIQDWGVFLLAKESPHDTATKNGTAGWNYFSDSDSTRNRLSRQGWRGETRR